MTLRTGILVVLLLTASRVDAGAGSRPIDRTPFVTYGDPDAPGDKVRPTPWFEILRALLNLGRLTRLP